MPRYSLFEGVKGVLCPHPRAALNSRRHPGMKRVPLADGEVIGQRALADLYEPCVEVFEEHRCLAKAVAAGHLKRLTGPVVADDITDAMAKLGVGPKLAPAPKPKASKDGGND